MPAREAIYFMHSDEGFAYFKHSYELLTFEYPGNMHSLYTTEWIGMGLTVSLGIHSMLRLIWAELNS